MAFAYSMAWRACIRTAVRHSPVGVSCYSTSTAAAAAALSPKHAIKNLKVCYGSQTGTAMLFSNQLVESVNEAAGGAVKAEAVDIHEFDHTKLGQGDADSAVVFILSCYGKGEPTDTAKKFYSWLMAQKPAGEGGARGLAGLDYSVFGLGSSKTHKEHYNVVGTTVDAKLEQLGANRMFPRGLGDDAGTIDLDFEAWANDFVQALKAQTGGKDDDHVATPKPLHAPGRNINPYHSEAEGAVKVVPTVRMCERGASMPKVEPPPLSGRFVPITHLQSLTPGDFRPAYEMHVALSGSEGCDYVTGDHVAVYPENSHSAVTALCERMRWDPDFEFRLEGSTKLPLTGSAISATVREVLTKHVDFSGALSPHILRTLGAHCTDPAQAERVIGMGDRATFTATVRDAYLSLSDLLRTHDSLYVPLDRFLTTFPPILPRYYSVSSSDKMHLPGGSGTPGSMHITFRHLRVPRPDGSVFEGLCSTYMASRKVGDRMRVAVRPSEFRLPADGTVPILMIAGGIGIAPFKAFLEERLRTGARGQALLLYGCRDASDQLYKSLMDVSVSAGALTGYDVAYAAPSRTTLAFTPRPRLAHELVEEHSADVWRILNAGGNVYVCGGAAGFGSAITATIKAVTCRHGGLTADAADKYMSAMLTGCRYLEDLAD